MKASPIVATFRPDVFRPRSQLTLTSGDIHRFAVTACYTRLPGTPAQTPFRRAIPPAGGARYARSGRVGRRPRASARFSRRPCRPRAPCGAPRPPGRPPQSAREEGLPLEREQRGRALAGRGGLRRTLAHGALRVAVERDGRAGEEQRRRSLEHVRRARRVVGRGARAEGEGKAAAAAAAAALAALARLDDDERPAVRARAAAAAGVLDVLGAAGAQKLGVDEGHAAAGPGARGLVRNVVRQAAALADGGARRVEADREAGDYARPREAAN